METPTTDSVSVSMHLQTSAVSSTPASLFNVTTIIVSACACDALGTIPGSTCNDVTGQCMCRENFVGRDCSECRVSQRPWPMFLFFLFDMIDIDRTTSGRLR